MLALVMAVVLVLGVAGVLVACGDSNGMAPVQPSAVKKITTGKQTSGSVSFTNYSVIITAETDWVGMPDAEKQKIIDYTFSEVYRMNAENDVRYYNVIGVTEQDEVLFMLDHDNGNVIVYINGQKAGTLEVPVDTTPPPTPTAIDEDEDEGIDVGVGAGTDDETESE